MLRCVCLLFIGLGLRALPLLAQPSAAPSLPPPPDSLQGLMHRPGTPAQRLQALKQVAEAYATHSDTARTLAYARAAARLARQLGNSLALGETLIEQGNTYFLVGALTKAERLAREALPLVQGHAQQVMAQRLLAHIYTRQNRPTDALAAYRAAYRAAVAQHDVLAQLNIDSGRGVLYTAQEQLDSADFYLLRAVRGFQRLPHPSPSARRAEGAALSNLASLNLRRKHYPDAARYARQSIALRLAIPDSLGLGPAYGVLHLVAAATDSMPQAMRYVRHNLWLSRRFHQLDGVQVCLTHLGNIFTKLGQPDSAEVYYRQAVASTRTGGQPVRRGAALLALAQFYDKQHRPAEALRTAQEAEALDSVFRSPVTTLGTFKLLAQLAEARHDDAAALRYFRRQRTLEQRQAAASSSKEIAALRVGFEAERTEQQLALATARAATEAQRATALRLLGQQHDAAYRDTLSQRERMALRQQLQTQLLARQAEQASQQVQALTQRNQAQTQQARLQEQAARLRVQQQELATLRARQQALGVAALAGLLALAGGALLWHYRRRQATRETALRTQLAADLHDDVGTLLSQISMQSGVLQEGLADPTGQRQQLDQIGEASRTAVRQLNDVVWSLDAHNDHLPNLLDRMRDYAEDVLAPAGLAVRVSAPAELPAQRLPVLLRRNLYLIYKEALHNVLKHAHGATQVAVTLRPEGEELLLEIADDGQPRPATGAVPRRSGHGLRNIKQRATAVGGNAEAAPLLNGAASGFMVRVRVPLGVG